MNPIQKAIASAAIGCALFGAAPAYAARDFTPQAGTWIVSQELNGKPGRGLAIDVQGNTFFMQVFAYEKNGDATFYAVTGQMDGNSVTAPLMRYQGGRSFGSAARDAVEDQSQGNVTVKFANGLQGTVQFPGEPEVAIQRYQVMGADFAARYWEQGRGRSFLVELPGKDQAATVLARVSIAGPGAVENSWRMRITDAASLAEQQLACEPDAMTRALRCTSAPTGAVAGDLGVQAVRLQTANADVYGTIDVVRAGVLQRFPLSGIEIGGDGGPDIAACENYGDLYVGDIPNCRPAITPSSGTWVVKDELLGKPGRGLAIDVQNGMAIAQVFNYLPNGSATFHMGSGAYQGEETKFPLNRYEGGRYLGGPAMSGRLAENTGDVSLRFAGGVSAGSGKRVSGWVSLPNEPEKQLVRLDLEPATSPAQGLLGQWLIEFTRMTGPSKHVSKHVQLTKVVGEAAVSVDDAVRCVPQADVARFFRCTWTNGDETWEGLLYQTNNDRGSRALQIRDRHGNLMGLGNVPLDD